MRFRAGLLSILVAGLLFPSPGQTAPSAARERLLKGRSREAVAIYSRLRLTKDPVSAAEYAYALALAGFKDLALGHLDQAQALQENSPVADGVVTFFAARVFACLEQADIAGELALQAVKPVWVPDGFKPTPAAGETDPWRGSNVETDVAIANTLLFQGRYYTAVDRFQQLVADHPTDGRSYAGYAIALEKIGAYRKAARAVGKMMELEAAKIDLDRKRIYTAHKQELETRPQNPPTALPPAQRINRTLKGRYLVFLGGNLHRTSQNSISAINGRVGKFFTNRFDASLSAGYTGGNIPKDYRGGSFGLAGRYHQPLPTAAPLNVTMGTRIEYQSRPSQKTSLITSPGLSLVQKNGSLDFFYEYGVSGRLKKTSTLSLGYTVYFGKTR
jgi:tetratricopeptide (TPR) repeat protein